MPEKIPEGKLTIRAATEAELKKLKLEQTLHYDLKFKLRKPKVFIALYDGLLVGR